MALQLKSASSSFPYLNTSIPTISLATCQSRYVSSSPYGRAHVWKHRQRVLPKPFVPVFPQLVVRADGSTFTHFITSPRSVIRLTRDTTNHALWNPGRWLSDAEEEDSITGRLGRFRRRFEDLGGQGGVDWMNESDGLGAESAEGAQAEAGKVEKEMKKKVK